MQLCRLRFLIHVLLNRHQRDDIYLTDSYESFPLIICLSNNTNTKDTYHILRRELDDIDRTILRLVFGGYSSPYAIWSYMKMDIDVKHKLAYFNVNKRVRNLAKAGILLEIKPDANTVNVHGRRDYMLSAEGFGNIAQYMTQPENDEKISKYIDFMKKHGLSQDDLEKTLSSEIHNASDRMSRLVKIFNLISESDELGFTLSVKPGPPSRSDKNKEKGELQGMFPDVKQTTTIRHSTPRIKRKTA